MSFKNPDKLKKKKKLVKKITLRPVTVSGKFPGKKSHNNDKGAGPPLKL